VPANLPPQYFAAEKNFREAKDPQEKIAALEEMIAVMPKHKGTDHLKAELRARISKLNQEAGHHAGGTRASMVVEREGAGQVAVIGLPNAGKSQLVTVLTKAAPLVADYPLTTHAATPGMMPYGGIQIQLIDTPPLAPQTVEWWLPPMLRRADALLVMVDLSQEPVRQLESIKRELEKMRIELGDQNSESYDGSPAWHKKALAAGNKADLDEEGLNFQALREACGGSFSAIAISALHGSGLEELKQLIFETLDVIRVYTKTPGRKADLQEPFVLPRGSTLADAAASVHKDLAGRLKFARLWGSGKHEGMMVRRDYVLSDGDVIELHG
jgi:uncharacterized protein